MEGFWTVQFKGVQGWGAGVVTMIAGRVFGGDSVVMFMGTYSLVGNDAKVQIHVKQFMEGLMNVMGPKEFDLDLAGKLEDDKLTLAGSIPGTELKLNAVLNRQALLPARA